MTGTDITPYRSAAVVPVRHPPAGPAYPDARVVPGIHHTYHPVPRGGHRLPPKVVEFTPAMTVVFASVALTLPLLCLVLLAEAIALW